MICLLRNSINFFFLLIVFLGSCKKFLDVGYPPDKIVAKYVFESNASAASVLTGIYPTLNIVQGQASISTSCGLSADELNAFPTAFGALSFYNNSGGGDFYWSIIYTTVYKLNAALEGLLNSSGISLPVRDQLIGEVLFLRAFSYFYLTNLYGGVPLLTTTDYKTNANASRAPVDEVYKQIVLDLDRAKSLLNDDYLASNVIDVSEERLRPNKSVAAALLARVYLYMGKWNDAKKESTSVIDNHSLYAMTDLDNVFLKNSREAIWQIQPQPLDGVFFNTLDGRMYILENGPNDSQNPVWLSDFLLISFESEDSRARSWINLDSSTGNTYYYPFKYKKYKNDEPVSEYSMVLRLAEQYLIRAEASVELGGISEACNDLNVVRRRAGLKEVSYSNKGEILNAILHERQVELFTEWGHRWFDLKRKGRINDIMSRVTPHKGGLWESYKSLFPIPFQDIQLNNNIVQNEGYNF